MNNKEVLIKFRDSQNEKETWEAKIVFGRWPRACDSVIYHFFHLGTRNAIHPSFIKIETTDEDGNSTNFLCR